MKSSHVLLALFAALIITPVAHGQDSATNQDEQQTEIKNKKGDEVTTVSEIPVKILVVINEFEGAKKIATLPYTLYTLSAGPGSPFRHPVQGPRESMRYQLRIPIVTGTFQQSSANGSPVSTQFTYQDVGTDIDYTARTLPNDSYELDFTVDRTWASLPGSESQRTPAASERGFVVTGQPILPHFRNNFVVMLKDGQTVEGASATDPVSGHVLKVDVTLTVLK